MREILFFGWIACAIFLACINFQANGVERGRSSIDMEDADYSILATLMIQKNKNSRYLCTENAFACIGADKADLALGLIAWSKDKNAPKKLLELSKYRFDSALSEDYKCYIIMRHLNVLDMTK